MHTTWNDWFFGWGWLLWVGFIVLAFSGMGNWGYSYSAHRKYDSYRRTARDILDERYARGEISREDYGQLKADIASA